jgi:hypothetical protein
VSEPFAGIIFDRACGELKGRGNAIGLSPRTVGVFAILWEARGLAGTDVRTRFGRDKADSAIRSLRLILPRFGLAVRSDRRGGHRLVDLQHQHEKVTS